MNLRCHEKSTAFREQWDVVALYCAVRDFEAHVNQALCCFTYQGGTVAFKNPDFHKKNTIFEQKRTWATSMKGKESLVVIAKARHSLFHRAEGLALSEALLHLTLGVTHLAGVKDWFWAKAIPEHPDCIVTVFDAVRVTLTLTEGCMRIPVHRDHCFVGREKEKKDVVDGLVVGPKDVDGRLPGVGRRVLIWGNPGVGRCPFWSKLH